MGHLYWFCEWQSAFHKIQQTETENDDKVSPDSLTRLLYNF